ncbi:MAG: dihydroorotate dehydrogenase [Candidatus Thermoplasmatota archaeon]
MPNLAITIAGLKLKKPLILASGIFGETGESLLRVANAGAGAVVTKSITLKPIEGYKNPTFVELEHGLLNAIGLANPGIEEYSKELKVALKGNVPVIGSIAGKSTKEFNQLATKMEEFGAHAIELNLSCPHAKGYGMEICEDLELVVKIIRNVKSSVKIPVFAKIPAYANLQKVGKVIENAGADAIVAINSVKAMKIDLDTRMPILSNKVGGYSGKVIKPIGVRCVYELASTINIPVIGCGGILSGEDVIEYLMAGATAVQIGSAVYYRNIEVFKKIEKELKYWMEKNNYRKVEELIGLALRK